MRIQASLKVTPKSYQSRAADYALVDEALKIIKDFGLKYEIGTSETTVEGEREQVLKLIIKIQDYYYQKQINHGFLINFEYNDEKFYIANKKENIAKI